MRQVRGGAVSRVRGISFDFGHVLVGLDLEEVASRLRPHCAAVDLDAVRAVMPVAYAAHDRVVAEGGGHEAGWRALVRTLVVAGAPGIVDADAMVEALWQGQATRNLWRHVPPPARTMLDALAAQRIPLVITSNSEGHLAALVRELGLDHYFLRVLDSGVLGISKPDRRIFALAAETLGVPLAEMVHVGDSESADVVGAIDAGAQAIRFDGFVPGAAARPTRAYLRLDDHAALLAALLAATSSKSS